MAGTSRKTNVGAVAEAVADMEPHSGADPVSGAELPEAGAASETGTAPETPAVAGSGEAVFIPLNKLKKSPRNARKTPHSPATIEALAASIAVKGMLQKAAEHGGLRYLCRALLRFRYRGQRAGLDRAPNLCPQAFH